MDKHSGTLIRIDDPRLEPETRQFYERKMSQDNAMSRMLIAFDRAVQSRGSRDPEEAYSFAIVSHDQLARFSREIGGLGGKTGQRVQVGVDRLKYGLIAFDLETLQ